MERALRFLQRRTRPAMSGRFGLLMKHPDDRRPRPPCYEVGHGWIVNPEPTPLRGRVAESPQEIQEIADRLSVMYPNSRYGVMRIG